MCVRGERTYKPNPIMITSPRAFIPVTRLRCARLGALFSILPLITGTVSGQTSPVMPAEGRVSGTITGIVSNTATGANLEGAEVTLQPGNVMVLSSRDGRFVIPQVAPGTYVLSASYSGLDVGKADVRVSAGATASQDIGLSSGVYQLSKFVVEGEREGNALAITQRRNAVNVKDVISSDAFGNVADLNLVNFLQRMPGISKEESEVEILLIRIRGVDSNMNAVSIDVPSVTRTYISDGGYFDTLMNDSTVMTRVDCTAHCAGSPYPLIARSTTNAASKLNANASTVRRRCCIG